MEKTYLYLSFVAKNSNILVPFLEIETNKSVYFVAFDGTHS